MMSRVPEISGGVRVNFGPVVGEGFDEITEFSKCRRPDSAKPQIERPDRDPF